MSASRLAILSIGLASLGTVGCSGAIDASDKLDEVESTRILTVNGRVCVSEELPEWWFDEMARETPCHQSIPEATVRVENADGQASSVNADEEGRFSLPPIKVTGRDTDKLAVSALGFSGAVLSGIGAESTHLDEGLHYILVRLPYQPPCELPGSE